MLARDFLATPHARPAAGNLATLPAGKVPVRASSGHRYKTGAYCSSARYHAPVFSSLARRDVPDSPAHPARPALGAQWPPPIRTRSPTSSGTEPPQTARPPSGSITFFRRRAHTARQPPVHRRAEGALALARGQEVLGQGQPRQRQFYYETALSLGTKALSVPGFVFCRHVLIGYDTAETTGAEIARAIGLSPATARRRRPHDVRRASGIWPGWRDAPQSPVMEDRAGTTVNLPLVAWWT